MTKPDNNSKNKLIAVAVSLLLHTAVVGGLFLIFLSASAPEERGGIMVNIGDAPLASGLFMPHQLEPDYQPQPQPSEPVPTEEETLLTQERDNDVPTVREKKVDKKKDEERRRQIEQRRLAEQRKQKELEEQRRLERINKEVKGAFGNTGNKGSGTDPDAMGGREGSPTGNVNSGGSNTGTGGFGSFDLGGRNLSGGGLVRPDYSVQEEGNIVVRITVNPQGQVINALIEPLGTTIGNQTLRNSALRAARATRFNAVEHSNNQSGTITYRFRLRK